MAPTLRINWIMPRANMSGGTKSNRLMAEAMVRRGHDVTIVFPDLRKQWPSLRAPRRLAHEVWKEIRAFGLQKHHLEESTATLLPVKSRPIVASQVPDADVTIATWWQTREWIENWPACKGLRAYFIRGYEIHSGDPGRVKATYRMPALKLVIARWLKRLMADEFGDREAVVVPNGVDWSQFESQVRRRSGVPIVGMYYAAPVSKGCRTAVEAIRIVQQVIPTLRVVAFGSEPWSRAIPKPRNLAYRRRPAQRDIPKIYQAADCWVVSSTQEGFGMPGLEAAASHCPLVSTRCGGPEDYVDEGVNGYLVPVGDVPLMADAVLRILHLPAQEWQRMSEASYAIAKRFDWDHSAEILESALLAALARDRPADVQRWMTAGPEP